MLLILFSVGCFFCGLGIVFLYQGITKVPKPESEASGKTNVEVGAVLVGLGATFIFGALTLGYVW